MRHLYSALIFLYGMALKIAALRNHKARLWVDGRKDWQTGLEKAMQGVDNSRPRVWFHASSLGEFEQGRPIIEAYRATNPGHFILLTFFSPSGYEVRKNYPGADRVLYIPLDTADNARRWIALVKPGFAMFIKYDFWFNFLDALKKEEIPVYFASALFRPGQHFFKVYGGWFRRQLENVSWFFVQNDESERLLKSIGHENVTLTGDTRFDRVYEIARKKQPFPLIEKFCNGHKVFIGGSTWQEDEALLFPMMAGNRFNLKFILAPHDTSPGRIASITSRLNQPFLLYSQLNEVNAESAAILIIDSVGILAQLYQYATLAFIGGGFGVSIHNIQEPITFGVPVFFGPRYHKFKEATDLVAEGGVFCVDTAEALSSGVKELLSNPEKYNRSSAICKNYVDANRGATDMIMKFLGEGIPSKEE